MNTNKHWSLRTIEQTPLADGYTIVITTDVPCHLWMRWSTQQPQIHIIPVLRRGIEMHGDTYFCFTVYKDNEQEEADDTLVHTFIKHDWPICETRYFYFTGCIAGEAVKSTSGIFQKHFLKVAVEHEITIIAHLKTWYMDRDGVDWDVIHAADPAGVWGDVTYLYLESYHYLGRYYLSRSSFMFDTSAIPLDAQIIDAHLDFYGLDLRDYGNGYLCLTEGQDLPWSSCGDHGYHDLLAKVAPIATPIRVADIPENEYYQFPFNELGKQQIGNASDIPGGMSSGTIIPIRLNHDRLNKTPEPEVASGAYCYFASFDYAFPPKLYVKYLA